MNFIFTCLPQSHPALYDRLDLRNQQVEQTLAGELLLSLCQSDPLIFEFGIADDVRTSR